MQNTTTGLRHLHSLFQKIDCPELAIGTENDKATETSGAYHDSTLIRFDSAFSNQSTLLPRNLKLQIDVKHCVN